MVLTVQGQTANPVVIATGAPINTTQNFFVAPNGNDNFSGTLQSPDAGATDGPFASLARAQSAVRNLVSTNRGSRCRSFFAMALLSPLSSRIREC